MLFRITPLVVSAVLVCALDGCGGRHIVAHGAPGAMLETPKSLSPGSVPAPPMARTAIQPSSVMMSVRHPSNDIQGLAWVQLPGGAIAVAASPDGSIWALSSLGGGADRAIWHYANGAWTNVPGAAARLAVGPDNALWAVNAAGGIYRYDGSSWSTLAGGASDISVGADGSVYVISNQGGGPYGRGIWRYANGAWSQLPGAADRIAASWDTGAYAIGNIEPGGFYVTNAPGGIYYYNASAMSFSEIPGAALQVAPTTSGGLFALGDPSNPAHGIYYNDLFSGNWSLQAGAGVSVATAGDRVYAVGAAGGIYTAPVAADPSQPLPADVTVVDSPVTDDPYAGDEDEDAVAATAATGRQRAPRGVTTCALAPGLTPPLKTALNVQSPFGQLRKNGVLFRAHLGADITAAPDIPVYAATSGIVSREEQPGEGYGLYVIVKAADGRQTRYAHLSHYGPLKSGAAVTAGWGTNSIIGYTGTSGYDPEKVTPHLHFEYASGDIKVTRNHLNPCGPISTATVQIGAAGNAATTYAAVDGKSLAIPSLTTSATVNAHPTAIGVSSVSGGPSFEYVACGNAVFKQDALAHGRYLGPVQPNTVGPVDTTIVAFLDPGSWSKELALTLPNGQSPCPAPPPPDCNANPTFYSAGQTCMTWWGDDATGMPATLTLVGYDPAILVVSGALDTLPAGYSGPYPPASHVTLWTAGTKSGTTSFRVLATHGDGTSQYYSDRSVTNVFGFTTP
jgi:virginiamycin B lyase